MQKFSILVAGIALAATVATPTEALALKATDFNREIDVHQAMRRLAPNTDVFASSRVRNIQRSANPLVRQTVKRQAAAAEVSNPSPISTIVSSSGFSDLDGPNGELWYYTMQLSSNTIEHEYYTEYILQEYTFEIYNQQLEKVGTIHDKMRYTSDEVRVPGPANGIDLLPVITKNFFNNDDNYEVVVSLAVNTTTPGFNHYRSVIYSIGGPKETVTIDRRGSQVQVEVDKPIDQYNSFVVDVLDASTTEEENYYMTFMSEVGGRYDINFDKLLEGDETEREKYWQAQSTGGLRYVTYAKAGADGKIRKVFENAVTYQTSQGDQESTPPMVTLAHNGQAYLLCPHYEKTFFLPYFSPMDDMQVREDNNFIIELYRLNGLTSEKVANVSIPVVKRGGEQNLCTYYSVGDLRFNRDVLFDDNGAVSFIVTICDYNAAADATTGFTYYIYDSTGKKTSTLFEYAESNMTMSNIVGFPEQHMFVKYDEVNDARAYYFVNIPEGYNKRKTVWIDADRDPSEDYDMLAFNCDRVAIGDSYKYAFEMLHPTVDEYDNDVMRIAWFNADGSEDRTDFVNMGTSVYYATVYIEGLVLDPTLVVDDDVNEYMILIKRGISSTTSTSQEELLVAQPMTYAYPTGRNIMHLKPDGQRGSLRHIGVYPGKKAGTLGLLVTYDGVHGTTADFYELPMLLSAIDEITADGLSASQITYDGTALYAEGFNITIVDINGRIMAEGRDSVTVGSLVPGIYVGFAGQSVNKFVVK